MEKMKKKILIRLLDNEIPSHKERDYPTRQAIISDYISLGRFIAETQDLYASDLINYKDIFEDIKNINKYIKLNNISKDGEIFITRDNLERQTLSYTPSQFIKLWNTLNTHQPPIESFSTGIKDNKKIITMIFAK